MQQGDPYRFTDTGTYMRMVWAAAPRIDDLTVRYLDEAVRDFYAGCFLSASVMVGVAAESLFNRLVNLIATKPAHAARFAPVNQQRSMLRRIIEFQQAIQGIRANLPQATREDLDTNLNMIQAVLRTHRNENGHPTGAAISREQMFVNLQLFAPFARKLEQLEDYFNA